MFRGQTHWMELKIGKPSLDALRPGQRDFGLECVAKGVPFWICFGHRHTPIFFAGVQVDVPTLPPWWRGAASLRR